MEKRIDVGQIVYIDDLCFDQMQSLAGELGIGTATQAKLVLTTERQCAKIEYFQVVGGEHEGEAFEVTTTYQHGRPVKASARWLHSTIVLIWLKYAIWDARRVDIEFARAAS